MHRPPLQNRNQPRQQRARVTMEAIIIAAIRVLEAEGLERLSMRRIAEVAGVSVGAMYKYFQNREAILGAIIDRQLEETLVSFHSRVAHLAGLPLEPAIRGVLFGMFEAARAHEKLHAALFEEMSPARRTTQHARMLDAYVELAAIVLKLRGDVAVSDPWPAAKLIIHASDGVIRWLFAHGDEASARVMLDEAARMIVRYLAPEPRT